MEIVNYPEFFAQINYLYSVNKYQQNYIDYIDYRYEAGFRLKKVMFAYRETNQEQQTSVWVTFNKHDFSCHDRYNQTEVQKSNYVKVSPIVIPTIIPGEYTNQEIINFCEINEVYGIFYFAIMSLNYPPFNVFHGKLYVYMHERIPRPNPVAIITAVFPYYNYRGDEYTVYIHFDDSPLNYYHQTRLTRNETAKGIHTMNQNDGLNTIYGECVKLCNPGLAHRYAAIYVGQFTTLTLIFENNQIDQNRGFRRPLCHERALIQRGGCVGLERYELRFQFMDNPRIYNNLQELAQSRRINCAENIEMAGIVNPLIFLGSPRDTTNQPNKQAPFPGYGLRVQNTDPGNLKPATLLLPTGARITTVNFYPYINEYGYPISKGYQYLRDLWNRNLFMESTGKYCTAENGTDGRIRSAFINGYGPCLAPQEFINYD